MVVAIPGGCQQSHESCHDSGTVVTIMSSSPEARQVMAQLCVPVSCTMVSTECWLWCVDQMYAALCPVELACTNARPGCACLARWHPSRLVKLSRPDWMAADLEAISGTCFLSAPQSMTTVVVVGWGLGGAAGNRGPPDLV